MDLDCGFKFWERVDHARGNLSLIDFGKECDINYASLKSMRSRCQIPKISMLMSISNRLNVSIDYLLSGKDNFISPEMAFVRDNDAAKLLIKKLMSNPSLLEHVSALIVLSEPEVANVQKQA